MLTKLSWAGKCRGTFERARALGTTHLSCYSLTVEQGTPLANMVRRGAVSVELALPGKTIVLECKRRGFAMTEGAVTFHKGLKRRTFISVLPVAQAAE